MLPGVLLSVGLAGATLSRMLNLDPSVGQAFDVLSGLGAVMYGLKEGYTGLVNIFGALNVKFAAGIIVFVAALSALTNSIANSALDRFNQNPINTRATTVRDTRGEIEARLGPEKAEEMFPELYVKEKTIFDDLETFLRNAFSLMGAVTGNDPIGAQYSYETEVNRREAYASDPTRAMQWLKDNPIPLTRTASIVSRVQREDEIRGYLREGLSPDEVAKTMGIDAGYVEKLYQKWYKAGDASANQYISLLTKALDATGELLQKAQEAMQKAMESFQTPLNRLMSRAQVVIQELFEEEKKQLENERLNALSNVEVLYDGEMIRLGVLQQQYDALKEQSDQVEKLQKLEESRTAASEAALDMFDASVDPLERARAARDAARDLFRDEQRARLDAMGSAIQAGQGSSAYVGTSQFYDEKAKALELDQAERSRVMQERIDDLLKKIQEGKISKKNASAELKDIFGDVGLDLEVASAQGYSFMESFSSGFMAALQANINSTFAALPKAITAALNVLAQSAAYKKAQDALNAIMNPTTETRTVKGQTMVDLLKARISDAKNLQTKLREYYAFVSPNTPMDDPKRVKQFNQIGKFLYDLEKLQNYYTPGGKYTSGQYDDLNTGFMSSFGTLLQMVMAGLSNYSPDRNRAMGGSLSAATNYMVGERGPEMLTMFKQGGGYVTPNHKLPPSLKSSAGALRAGAYGRAVGGYVGFGGGRAEGGPVDAMDVGRGYDGRITYLEDYTDPATRFIHQILQSGSSNSELAGRGSFVDLLSSFYKGGIKSIVSSGDLVELLRKLAGTGVLPRSLDAFVAGLGPRSNLSNVSKPVLGSRDEYDLNPGHPMVVKGIWKPGSRPLATGVVRSVVGGIAGDYESLGGLLMQGQQNNNSKTAADLMNMGGIGAPISVVTRPGYKPSNVTTTFNDALSGDGWLPVFPTDPGSFPEAKRGQSLSGSLPRGGSGARNVAEFQIPGGIPIDQIEAIFGLDTMVDEITNKPSSLPFGGNQQIRRPLNDAEFKARAAVLAEMGFTDLGNHAVATDVLNQQIADWRSSTSADAVDPETLAKAKAELIRQQEMGRIIGTEDGSINRHAQANSLLRAGVFTSVDEAALYAATAEQHFKKVAARKVDAEAERRRVARTVPRNLSFEDKIAAIRERLLYTQPELFPEIGAEAPALRMLLDDAPVVPKAVGEQLDLFSDYKKPPKLDDLVAASRARAALTSLRVGDGLAGKPAQRATQGDVRPGLLQRILGKVPGVGGIISQLPLFDYAKNQTFLTTILGTDKSGMPIGYDSKGVAADLISFDWGDVRIPHELVERMSAPQLDRLSQGMRLALSAAPQGMFDPSDPGKRILVDVVDTMNKGDFAARVPRLNSNYIQVQRTAINDYMPDAAIHEVGHLMHNRKYNLPKVLLELFKPSNIAHTIATLKGQGSMFGLIARTQEKLVMEGHIKAYERALIAQGLDPIQARIEANSRPIGVSPQNWNNKAYKMPVDFPRPTIYSGADPLEHFAEIFLGHTQESLPDSTARRTLPVTMDDAMRGSYPSAGQMLDLNYDKSLALHQAGLLSDLELRTAAAKSQYPREVARRADFRRIVDPGAVAAGLMPELYGPKYRKVAVPFTGGKVSLPGMKTWTPDQGGFKGAAARADSSVGTGKGNFLAGFLADIGMMVASGNWDFGQLIASAGFNLLSVLPKIGGPAAMAAGLLTTAATGGDMGRAMAGTVGSLIGGVLGNLIPIPFIGGMIGSILGGMLGDWIYTTFLNPESANQGTQTIRAGGKAIYNVGPIDGRASGGPVRPNVAYMVGERGPEIMVPGGLGGSIIPNHKMPTSAMPISGGLAFGGPINPPMPRKLDDSTINWGDKGKTTGKVPKMLLWFLNNGNGTLHNTPFEKYTRGAYMPSLGLPVANYWPGLLSVGSQKPFSSLPLFRRFNLMQQGQYLSPDMYPRNEDNLSYAEYSKQQGNMFPGMEYQYDRENPDNKLDFFWNPKGLKEDLKNKVFSFKIDKLQKWWNSVGMRAGVDGNTYPGFDDPYWSFDKFYNQKTGNLDDFYDHLAELYDNDNDPLTSGADMRQTQLARTSIEKIIPQIANWMMNFAGPMEKGWFNEYWPETAYFKSPWGRSMRNEWYGEMFGEGGYHWDISDYAKNLMNSWGGDRFASGGNYSGRSPFLVGENGPEIMVPGGLGGSIIPNHKIRGPEGVSAVGGVQTVNASVVINNPSVSNAGDIDRLAKKVTEAQTRALRSAGYARPS